MCTTQHFYPRSPCGERPAGNKAGAESFKFLSTLSLRRATEIPTRHRRTGGISIHALLAESDTPRLSRVVPTPIFLSTLSLRRATFHKINCQLMVKDFYPRSPCGERQLAARDRLANAVFLSTLSLRRATFPTFCSFHQPTDFYPRSPCGERRQRT